MATGDNSRNLEDLGDEELVAEYLAHPDAIRGSQAINQLFNRHYQRVSLWCYRLTGNQETAADIAQNVFLKVFRNLDSFRGEAKFSTWLYMIARNETFNACKATPASELVGEELSEIADKSLDPHEQLLKNSSRKLLQDLIRECLTEIEAKVMTLHYVHELPLQAITRMFQLDNASGAKAYIVSARRKLARVLDRESTQRRASVPGGTPGDE